MPNSTTPEAANAVARVGAAPGDPVGSAAKEEEAGAAPVVSVVVQARTVDPAGIGARVDSGDREAARVRVADRDFPGVRAELRAAIGPRSGVVEVVRVAGIVRIADLVGRRGGTSLRSRCRRA